LDGNALELSIHRCRHDEEVSNAPSPLTVDLNVPRVTVAVVTGTGCGLRVHAAAAATRSRTPLQIAVLAWSNRFMVTPLLSTRPRGRADRVPASR
jgi:hypothetical protein